MVYRGVLSLTDADDDTRLHVASRQVTAPVSSVWRTERSFAVMPAGTKATYVASVIKRTPTEPQSSLERESWASPTPASADRASQAGQAVDGWARWRFAWGCLVAVLDTRDPLHDPGRRVVRLIGAGAAVSGGLVAFALVHYPGLRAGRGTWPAVLVFLAVLAGYLVVGRLTLVGSPPGGAAVRVAVLSSTVTVGGWVLVGAATWLPPVLHAGLVAVAGIVAAPLAAGVWSTLRSRSRAVACTSAVLAGLMSGLVVFLVWSGETILTGGRPYDVGQVRDFHSSGGADLATFAVSDNLGTAMVLLVLVPLIVTCLGFLGATAGSLRRLPARIG